MGIVRLQTAERVVHERRRFEWTIRKILKPPTPSLVTHEDVQLSVRAESHHAAVVITCRIGVGRAWVAWNFDIVCLKGTEADDVLFEGQGRAIPDEAVNAVAEQRHCGVDARVCAGTALGPWMYINGVAGKFGCRTRLSSPRSELEFTARSSTGLA